MKIAYLNPTNNIRRPIAELAQILAQKGEQITIVYPESSACPTKNWVANEVIQNSPIQKVPIKSRYFAPLRYNFPQLLQTLREIKKVYQNNDKVHIWEYYYPLSILALLYASLSKKRRAQTILTTDGFVGYSYQPKEPKWLVPLFKTYTQLFARFLFKIPQTMTTYGESMLPFAKKAGVPLHKLKVISTGIHLEKFQKPNEEKIRKLKEEFNLKDEKIILFVGMLTERKGVDKVIDVSIKLLEERLKVKTLLVGDAHGENKYAQLVPEKYKDKIIFTGGRKEIPEFMHLAEVLLLPSEGEGLPGAVMEAMASGLPVVATKEGCTPDLIEDEKEGLLLEIGMNYYNAVKKIISNPKLSQEFSEKSQQKIKRFEWEMVSKKYEELYR